jgi:hypothetical protein
MSSLSAAALLRPTATYEYILANLTFLSFLHPVLPGLLLRKRDVSRFPRGITRKLPKATLSVVQLLSTI